MNGLTFNTRFDEQIVPEFNGNQNIDHKNIENQSIGKIIELKNKFLLKLCCVPSDDNCEDALKTCDNTLKDEETVIRR